MNLIPIPIFWYINNCGNTNMSDCCFWWIVGISIFVILILLSILFYMLLDDKINDFIYDCKIFFKDLYKGF